MAWISHGSDNGTLVDALVSNKLVSAGSRVESAMRAVNRGAFCTTSPFVDAPQILSHNATISAPHMHAHALALLASHLRPGARCLDVGAGSGYLTACMAEMVATSSSTPSVCVIGVEHVPELVAQAVSNVARACPAHVRDSIQFTVGDGRMGAAGHGPFNAIHVGAAAESIPQVLIAQLAPGGRMVVPIGPRGGEQLLTVIDKNMGDDSFRMTRAFGVRYVPLCSVDEQVGPPPRPPSPSGTM
jgi:protein-L-isoaspartate(D-aspartate) O-methyltransferase